MSLSFLRGPESISSAAHSRFAFHSSARSPLAMQRRCACGTQPSSGVCTQGCLFASSKICTTRCPSEVSTVMQMHVRGCWLALGARAPGRGADHRSALLMSSSTNIDSLTA
eukprot:4146727-Prymnesium_polylepis.1